MKFSEESPLADQIVPWIQPTHDRYVAEIMRGCSRGCRFCHAGFFYRPVREKDPDLIRDQIAEAVNRNGWEEVALTSLSSSDYGLIRDLILQLWELAGCRNTKLSLPSLRVDTLDSILINLMNEMQQKSITIAPEAGSQRLRDRINKNISEEEILKGIKTALQNGWRVLKLYFMIGLPFETEEDIEELAELVEKIVTISGRRLQINITLSPFVPKPFTPFQWAEAAEREKLLSRVYYLKNRLKRYRFIKLKYHTIEYQALECALGRGNRKVGSLILAAYREGAMFDGWDEFFDFAAWQRAEILSGVKFGDYQKAIDLKAKLPWDHIDIGIDKEFLQNEYQKAAKGITTEDCRIACTGCGLCTAEIKPVYQKKIDPLSSDNKTGSITGDIESYRIFYEKGEEIRYIGHLDMLRMTHRLVRASGLPIIYSEGYNRHPQVSFGPPLPLGMLSKCEYFDLKLVSFGIEAEVVKNKLKAVFPPGMKIVSVQTPVTKAMHSMEYYSEEELSLTIPQKKIDLFEDQIKEFLSKKEWKFYRERKGKQKLVDLKTIIKAMNIRSERLKVQKKVSGASIYDILEHVFKTARIDTGGMKITREKLIK